MLQCSFGIAPSTLVVLPVARVLVEGKPAAAITDMVPAVNIPPFGMCSTPTNPAVAAATAAALGVLTPMPCLPVIPAPWAPGVPNVLITSIPALDDTCKLACTWTGVISITFAGQATHQIP